MRFADVTVGDDDPGAGLTLRGERRFQPLVQWCGREVARPVVEEQFGDALDRMADVDLRVHR